MHIRDLWLSIVDILFIHSSLMIWKCFVANIWSNCVHWRRDGYDPIQASMIRSPPDLSISKGTQSWFCINNGHCHQIFLSRQLSEESRLQLIWYMKNRTQRFRPTAFPIMDRTHLPDSLFHSSSSSKMHPPNLHCSKQHKVFPMSKNCPFLT